jgi:S-sulfo-L-cysteine synthase (O-acetyl-L-serine-dependent)
MSTTAILRSNKELLSRLHLAGASIGNTPLVPLPHLFRKKNVQLFAKLEWKQLSGSVKARAAYQIIKDAIENYELDEEITLLDATSGNTGIAYAAIGKQLGIKVTLCLPENASKERKQILQSLGATIILTSKYEGTDGAQQVAREMAEQHPDKYFYADQYKNENNWKAHYHTTAVEIYNELPSITHFVAGLGTTGTFVGTGRRLKEFDPAIQLISLQPDSAMHALEGWKHLETAVVPDIYDDTVADAAFEVSTEEAYETLKTILKYEGWLVSPSAAANVAGAIKLANKLKEGVIVTMLPDNADKYGDVIKNIL